MHVISAPDPSAAPPYAADVPLATEAQLAAAEFARSIPVELPRGQALPMHRLLARLCIIENCSFSFRGTALDPLHVLAPEMFLPALAATAQEQGQYLAEWDAGCQLRADDESLFGVRSVVPHVTGHPVDLWRALLFAHSLRRSFGVRENSVVDLTAIYEHMREPFNLMRERAAHNQGDIPWPQMQRVR